MDDLITFLKERLDEDETWFRDPRSVDDPVGEDLRQQMLRTIAAMRTIIAEHELVPVTWDASRYDFGCRICHDWDSLTTPGGYCTTLRAITAVYSDHPDYRAEWAVTSVTY